MCDFVPIFPSDARKISTLAISVRNKDSATHLLKKARGAGDVRAGVNQCPAPGSSAFFGRGANQIESAASTNRAKVSPNT